MKQVIVHQGPIVKIHTTEGAPSYLMEDRYFFINESPHPALHKKTNLVGSVFLHEGDLESMVYEVISENTTPVSNDEADQIRNALLNYEPTNELMSAGKALAISIQNLQYLLNELHLSSYEPSDFSNRDHFMQVVLRQLFTRKVKKQKQLIFKAEEAWSSFEKHVKVLTEAEKEWLETL